MSSSSKNRKSRALASCLRCRKVLGNVITHARWCGVESRYDPERFWAKVDKSGGPDACWPYTGYITPEGYGWAYTGLPTGQQQTHGAHRQAWINTFGPIPGDLQVCHHCDNPPCCNPKHLFTGTNKDNTQDMLRKERQQRKLDTAQAKAILAMKPAQYPRRTMGLAKNIADELGVCAGTIHAIWSGRAWLHIQSPEIQEAMKGYQKKKKGARPPPQPKGPRPRNAIAAAPKP